MKKIFCILLLPAFLSATSHQLSGQRFSFGVLSGVNASQTFSASEDKEYFLFEPLIGYNLNIHSGYWSKSFWSVSMEPGFITKGYIWKAQVGNLNRQYGYINCPVLFNINFLKRLSISLGPEPAYLILAKSKFNGQTTWYKPNSFNRIELSGIAGFHCNLFAGLDIGMRYSRAFTPHITYIINNDYSNWQGKGYNQYLQLLLRYRFIRPLINKI